MQTSSRPVGARRARGPRAPSQPPSPDVEMIRARAYQIWEQEGRPEGRDLEHWKEAVRQLEVEFCIGFPDGMQ